MAKICNNSNNAQWITLYIKNYTKLHCHILVFVLKIISEKVVMHCQDSNQGRLTYEKVEKKERKKKKRRNTLPDREYLT